MSKYHNDNTYASLPGEMILDHKKLAVFKREFGFIDRWRNRSLCPTLMIEEHMQIGCCNAAVVMQTSPELLIAAYSDDFDWVVLLEFSRSFADQYSLGIGSRLVTVNTYFNGRALVCDLRYGPKRMSNWTNVLPFIADFLTSDPVVLNQKKNDVPLYEWDRVIEIGNRLIAGGKVVPRNGNPYKSGFPVDPLL